MADLHTHTGDDPYDHLDYSAEMLIDHAVQLHVDVLAIACHCRVVYSRRLAEYARRRGLLLIPAVETIVERKHVLILNPTDEHVKAATFAALRALGRRGALIVAAHPFYPAGACLREALIANIDLFDAIEYCCLYHHGINFNRRAARVARRFRLPLIGSSDTHMLPYAASTFSWIEAEECSIEAVLDAIRAGRVQVETCPPPLRQAAALFSFYGRQMTRYLAGLSELGG
jgi:hypothetical protein